MTSGSCTANTRYKYTTNGLQHPSGLDHVRYFSTTCGFIDIDATSDLYGMLL